MKLYSENENYKLYQGNMLDMLEVVKPNTIDSIITDPPYELNFMNKGWDNSGIAFQKETWQKCYEVLKPGGYLLAFGGSRTFHRIACAIEDAGFEIRDTICYMYGSGFPKSQNIGKQLEKRLEDEKTKQKTKHDLLSMWERDIQKTKSNEETSKVVLQSQLQEQSLQSSVNTTDNVWRKKPCLERWSNIQKTERELQWCQICEMSKRISINGEGRWICNGTQNCDGTALRKMFDENGSCPSYRPQPEQQFNRELNAIQEQWGTQACREVIENWKKIGTALKPSFEPIIVARKPFKGSLVDNVIEYGVGGINIDECRVGNEELHNSYAGNKNSGFTSGDTRDDKGKGMFSGNKQGETIVNGRFPANTILTYDETDFDTTSWLRYFYCAKASKKDRDEGLNEFKNVSGANITGRKEGSAGLVMEGGKQNPFAGKASPNNKNTHPTVKPTELMQYLVRLVSPNGATILDPFNGSGSTGKAVMYENREKNKNYKYIGIELTEEYLPIAKARIEYVCNLEEEKDMQMTIFDFIGDENE